jgi:hypothetical protein
VNCYRCGTRAVDPTRGPSLWRRGVRGGAQVLVCPACQAGRDWAGELDRCVACGSTILVRRLGEIACRECGAVTPAEDPAAVEVGSGELGEEVRQALDRMFGR